MAKSSEKLSKKQELACMAIITEPTMSKAAEKAGVGVTTLYRWQRSEGFQKQLKAMKQEVVEQATARLRNGMTIAIDALIEMAENKKTPAMARVTAAKGLLEFGFKAVEFEEIQQRMEEIEARLPEKEGKAG